MKKKKYLWILKEDLEFHMEGHETSGQVTVCNWHECEYVTNKNGDREWVRVTIDWDKHGERNKTLA